jgi:hypothetical protein
MKTVFFITRKRNFTVSLDVGNLTITEYLTEDGEWDDRPEEAKRHDDYGECVQIIESLPEPGFYGIEKVFVKE